MDAHVKRAQKLCTWRSLPVCTKEHQLQRQSDTAKERRADDTHCVQGALSTVGGTQADGSAALLLSLLSCFGPMPCHYSLQFGGRMLTKTSHCGVRAEFL